MQNKEFESYLNETVARIKALPEHNDEQRRIASDQLAMLHYSFMTGNLDVDIPNMRKADILKVLENIAAQDYESLAEKPNFEKPWTEDSPMSREEWANNARAARIRLAAEAFILMSRLRSDEPEAWDEVNELVFDD